MKHLLLLIPPIAVAACTHSGVLYKADDKLPIYGRQSVATPLPEADLFDGTWVGDMKSIRVEGKPSVYALKDGIYTCDTCVPKQSVQANGEFHPVPSHPRYDEMALKVVDSRTVKLTRRKAGRVVAEETSTVSPDGKRLRFTYTTSNDPTAPAVTESGSKRRVARGPEGSHAITGSWATDSIESIPEEELTVTYRIAGDMLKMSTPVGESYVAKLDGTDAVLKGGSENTVVSVKRLNASTIEETSKRGGKVVWVSRLSIAPGGRTMKVMWQNPAHGSMTTFVAHKQ